MCVLYGPEILMLFSVVFIFLNTSCITILIRQLNRDSTAGNSSVERMRLPVLGLRSSKSGNFPGDWNSQTNFILTFIKGSFKTQLLTEQRIWKDKVDRCCVEMWGSKPARIYFSFTTCFHFYYPLAFQNWFLWVLKLKGVWLNSIFSRLVAGKTFILWELVDS